MRRGPFARSLPRLRCHGRRSEKEGSRQLARLSIYHVDAKNLISIIVTVTVAAPHSPAAPSLPNAKCRKADVLLMWECSVTALAVSPNVCKSRHPPPALLVRDPVDVDIYATYFGRECQAFSSVTNCNSGRDKSARCLHGMIVALFKSNAKTGGSIPLSRRLPGFFETYAVKLVLDVKGPYGELNLGVHGEHGEHTIFNRNYILTPFLPRLNRVVSFHFPRLSYLPSPRSVAFWK